MPYNRGFAKLRIFSKPDVSLSLELLSYRKVNGSEARNLAKPKTVTPNNTIQ
jgi:hypothetical protein